jgi:hypothetical protein
MAEAQKKRKTSQEIANENLATAERVDEKAQKRVETTREAYVKAQQDAKIAARKVKAARMIALDEDTDAEIDPSVTDAADPAGDDDVLS